MELSTEEEDVFKKHYNFIIVGGGIAGVSCLEQILSTVGDVADVLLISSSPVVKEISNFTPVSKTLHELVVLEKSLRNFKDVHPSAHVALDEVIHLEPETKMIETGSGRRFSYEKLCICTGAVPKELNLAISSGSTTDEIQSPGPDKFITDRILTIRDSESVKNLATKLSSSSSVLLIGNGGIATELIYEMAGVDIVWAIKDESISQEFLDPGAAEFFLQSRFDVKYDVSKHTKIWVASNAYLECSTQSENVIKRKQYGVVGFQEEESKSKGFDGPGSALGPDWLNSTRLVAAPRDFPTRLFIEFKTEVKVIKRADPDLGQKPILVQLSNLEEYEVDLVICAVGVTPRCSFFPGLSNRDGGIEVKGDMSTRFKDTFAAGDICQPTWHSPRWFQKRLWTQARQMGLQAGMTMVKSLEQDEEKAKFKSSTDPTDLPDAQGCRSRPNVPETEDDLPLVFQLFGHLTRFFGFKVCLLGSYNGQGINVPRERQRILLRCTPQEEYVKILIVESKVQGAILIGETGLEETIENLILNQTDITDIEGHMLDPDFDLEDYFD